MWTLLGEQEEWEGEAGDKIEDKNRFKEEELEEGEADEGKGAVSG